MAAVLSTARGFVGVGALVAFGCQATAEPAIQAPPVTVVSPVTVAASSAPVAAAPCLAPGNAPQGSDEDVDGDGTPDRIARRSPAHPLVVEWARLPGIGRRRRNPRTAPQVTGLTGRAATRVTSTSRRRVIESSDGQPGKHAAGSTRRRGVRRGRARGRVRAPRRRVARSLDHPRDEHARRRRRRDEIPRFEEDFEIVGSDAAVLVIIEKDAIASRLAEERWWDSTRCIMVCSGGFPSMATREFVRKLRDTLGIPAVLFTDADPGGIQLSLSFAHGSISTALETPWLACNDLSWAGFWPSEVDRCRKSDLIRLSEVDHEAARALLAHPSRTYVNDRIRDELSILIDRGAKVELDTLMHTESRLGDYLQRKLSDGDLIRL